MTRTTHHRYTPACPKEVSDKEYKLSIRQQPIQARISTNNERDRRPIDPPPVVQIFLTDSSPQETDNLCHPTDDEEIYTPTHNALSGQTVSSLFKLNDMNNSINAFFIFGDLSVKVEGRYRLKLTLFQVIDSGAVCLSSIFTKPFTVYSGKNFPGALDSTFLSKSFSDQGARIKIRKDNRAQAIANLRKRKTEERRNSMTSHSSVESPIMSPPVHFPRVTLPPLSDFDKPISPSFFDTLTLPPLVFKRIKTVHEHDAVAAMIKLSQPTPPFL